jgi:hypothetical protein
MEGDSAWCKFGSKPYANEELVAEMGAAFLCARVGIFQDVEDNSAAYIANWLTRLQNDKTLVVHAAGKAQKAMDYICGDARQADKPTEAKPEEKGTPAVPPPPSEPEPEPIATPEPEPVPEPVATPEPETDRPPSRAFGLHCFLCVVLRSPAWGHLGVIGAAYIGFMALLATARSYFSNLLLLPNPSSPQSALHRPRYFSHTRS